MKRASRVASLTLAGALAFSACADAPSDEHVIDEPVKVEAIQGSDVKRVTLLQKAIERLDIQTTLVENTDQGLVVPPGAVLVDPTGTFWVYTNPEPRVFIRHKVTIAREESDKVYLQSGPPPGTRVATVGVPELYGSEFEIGH